MCVDQNPICPATGIIDPLPVASVIIPAYNEETLIGKTLEALRGLDYPQDKLEIIIVDNGSVDRTIEIAKRFGAVVSIQPELTVAGLRNHGAAMANGEVLAFIDADCMATREWLRCGVASLCEESCVTGATVDVPEDGGWIEKAWFAQEPKGRRKATHINSGNLIVFRDMFRQLGGFNESLITGEDYELCQRAWRVTNVISDDRIRVLHHGNPKTLRQFLRRESWHGLGAFATIRQNWMDKPLFGSMAFMLLTVGQAAGVVRVYLDHKPNMLMAASMGIVALLLATIYYRLGSFINVRLVVKLGVLYYLYYLGRSIALIRLLTGLHGRRRTR